jgi:acetyl-CoA carboxylase carboxyl transferase subunit alpha
VDEVIPEPLGGAHTAPAAMAATLKQYLLKHLKEVQALSIDERLKQRYDKFRSFGHFVAKQPTPAEKEAASA